MPVTNTYAKAPRLGTLYARAAAAALPGTSRLAQVPGAGGAIPADRFELHGIRAGARRLTDYRALCGFHPHPHLPSSYPHVLAFPLHLRLLTDGRFPFAPVGLIHIENSILQRRPIPQAEQLDLAVHATAAVPHPRGHAFSLITEAAIAGETVWKSQSTMLRNDRQRERANTEPPTRRGETQPERHGNPDTWTLPSDLGRRYASISGDRNPIHTHAFAARALGLPGAIAHGMWIKARVLAALAEELPDAHGIQVTFHNPIVLPATVRFTRRDRDGETELSVRDDERNKTHMRGRTWSAQAAAEPDPAEAQPA